MSLYSDEIGFAAGTLIATQTNGAALVTPRKFGILQDISLSFTADLKELYGQNRYAIALAAGKTKVELKAKWATIRGDLFNQTFFGATPTTSATRFAENEQHTVPALTPFTVSATNSGFAADQGVYYQLTGQPLSAVSALTAAGQYSASNVGVYTFDSADSSAIVDINYTYVGNGGVSIPIANPKMGVGPVFSVMLDQAFDGREQTYLFPNCQASKLTIPTKQDDYVIMELDFMISQNAAGIVGYINTTL